MAFVPRASGGSDSALPAPHGGLDLAAFRGVRYHATDPDQLARLTCPPYDVIDDRQRRALEESDPHNVVRLILPRSDADGRLPADSAAAALLSGWHRSGVLVTDEAPALYVYQMRERGTTVRGLIGAVALRAPETGVILPHENTMAGPVRQRQALIRAAGANLEPIYLVAAGAAGASAAAVKDATREPPLSHLVTADGGEHQLWAITDSETIDRIRADLAARRALIADGHHRYAAYLAHQEQMRRAGAGAGPWDRGLAFLVDSDMFGAQVEAFHRVVLGVSLPGLLERAAQAFTVSDLPAGAQPAREWLGRHLGTGAAFVVTDGQRWFGLTEPDPALVAGSLPAGRSQVWRGLDVVLAHSLLLERLWRVRVTEQTVRFVAGIEAAVEVARGGDGVAVLLNPTPLETVVAVAGSGERMPQKSTLFTPKPRTGMVLRLFGQDAATTPGIDAID